MSLLCVESGRFDQVRHFKRGWNRWQSLLYVRRIVGGLFIDAVDDDHGHRDIPDFQFQPELLVQRIEDRDALAPAAAIWLR